MKTRVVAAIVVALVAGTLAACGAKNESAGSAPTGTVSTIPKPPSGDGAGRGDYNHGSGGSAGADAANRIHKVMIRFVSCVRAAGVVIADPQLQGALWQLSPPTGPNAATERAGDRRCRHIMLDYLATDKPPSP